MSRAAVVMRIHFWDEFAQRQLDRLAARCGGADLHVLIDETGGPVSGVAHDKVLRLRADGMSALGLASYSAEGPVFWYLGDYPMYAFLSAQPDYDHYLFLEYDVLLTLDVGQFVAQAVRNEADVVSHFVTAPIEDWYWTPSHMALYDIDELRQVLPCIGLFSRNSLQFLLARRRAQSAALQNGETSMLPFCEAFIATELARAGFRLGQLADYGNISHLDWWPPWREAEIGSMPPRSFVHPVLDDARYVQSVLKYDSALSFFRPGSVVNVKLRGMKPSAYVPTLLARATRRARAVAPFRPPTGWPKS